jgi:hypothetical protein
MHMCYTFLSDYINIKKDYQFLKNILHSHI